MTSPILMPLGVGRPPRVTFEKPFTSTMSLSSLTLKHERCFEALDMTFSARALTSVVGPLLGQNRATWPGLLHLKQVFLSTIAFVQSRVA